MHARNGKVLIQGHLLGWAQLPKSHGQGSRTGIIPDLGGSSSCSGIIDTNKLCITGCGKGSHRLQMSRFSLLFLMISMQYFLSMMLDAYLTSQFPRPEKAQSAVTWLCFDQMQEKFPLSCCFYSYFVLMEGENFLLVSRQILKILLAFVLEFLTRGLDSSHL